MHRVKAAALEPMLDRAAAEPKAGKLHAGDHAVLALGKRGDQAVERMRATLTIYFMVKCTRVSHRRDAASESVSTDHMIATKGAAMSEQGGEPSIDPQPGELGEGRVDVPGGAEIAGGRDTGAEAGGGATPGGGPGGATHAPDEDEDEEAGDSDAVR
jgi:hypothetical protein